jgi:hypothetical protein
MNDRGILEKERIDEPISQRALNIVTLIADSSH